MSELTIEKLNEARRLIEEHGYANSYTGFKVMPNPHLTVPGPDQIVARTWRERMFTWPWRPLQKTRRIPTMIPDPKVYATNTPEMIKIIGYPAVFGHPETLKHFMAKISEIS